MIKKTQMINNTVRYILWCWSEQRGSWGIFLPPDLATKSSTLTPERWQPRGQGAFLWRDASEGTGMGAGGGRGQTQIQMQSENHSAQQRSNAFPAAWEILERKREFATATWEENVEKQERCHDGYQAWSRGWPSGEHSAWCSLTLRTQFQDQNPPLATCFHDAIIKPPSLACSQEPSYPRLALGFSQPHSKQAQAGTSEQVLGLVLYRRLHSGSLISFSVKGPLKSLVLDLHNQK